MQTHQTSGFTPRITVALVGDDRSVLNSWTPLLTTCGRVTCVGAYTDPNVALHELRRIRPEVVLIDVRKPGLWAIECTRLIKGFSPATSVIMVTAVDELSQMIESFQAGANGYLLKSSDPQLILQAIVCSKIGGTLLSTEMNEKLLHTRITILPAGSGNRGLSRRERDVLDLIARGYSDKDIAGKLGLSGNTTNGIKRSLFAKWNVHSRSEVILKCASAGTILPGKALLRRL